MVKEIAAHTEFGRLLGEGPAAVGRHFRHNRVPVVKNQSIAGYDPRAMQGMAATYATTPMGADHTAGHLLSAYSGGLLNPLEKNGQVEASKDKQIAVAALDSTGLCLFTLGVLDSKIGKKSLFDAISSLIDQDFGIEDFKLMGTNILKTELEFNQKAGMTEKDDRLPKFFYYEPLPPHGKTVLLSDDELSETLKI